MINCYVNNNNFNNNLNIYINKNSNDNSNQNSYNNSNKNTNTTDLINALLKSKDCNTPKSSNNNGFYDAKFKFEKNIDCDKDNKFEILEKNIQYVFSQYFQYYNNKNNNYSAKK